MDLVSSVAPVASLAAADSAPSSVCDSGAFAALYTEHFEFTWRALRYLGVATAQLDDAAQEVWLVVHHRLAEFQGRAQIRTWLFRIAVNISRNAKRGQRRRGVLEPLSDAIPGAGPDPAAAAEGRALLACAQAFLDGLDEERRAVFVGCLIEGLSPAECARAMGVSVILVYHRLRALRRSFKTWTERLEEVAE